MKTPLVSILLFAFAAVLGAVGQFCYKAGADRASGGLIGYVVNWRIVAGALMLRGGHGSYLWRHLNGVAP